MFKIINRDEKHRLAKEGAVANIAVWLQQNFNKQRPKKANIVDRVAQQTQTNPKYNNYFDYKFVIPLYRGTT